MDRGAHFHRCDFQVHTPRDRQWNGARPPSDTERQSFAEEFASACRTKGLRAVAITDHHDMGFIQYIREAAAAERNADGLPVTEEDRLVVFPGMELTLGVPCQALLIFDAAFPQDLFNLAANALAIVPASIVDDRAAETVRLDRITSLQMLHDKLDEHTYLRGRYIVLPNVSDGGTSTILRAGHSGHYREMPCVGGYLDGSIDQLGEGNTRILAGLDAAYGNKPLGLFQTSDCRDRSLASLGASSTWVKWAQPTAEALRQACLARETRLSQVDPPMPASSIVALDVSNSTFLGPIYLQFNRQYNALIGGRGTGKSTILEYLRWALCDEPLPGDVDDLAADQVRRRKLIEQTLKPVSATVHLHLLVNEVPHVIRRAAATGELALKIGAGAFETCKEADVRALLPAQAYSQKQLSGVGVRLEELRRFVQAPIRQELEDIRSRLAAKANTLRATHARVRTKRQIEHDLAMAERESKSIDEQSAAIRRDLVGLDEEDRALLSAQPKVEREADVVRQWQNAMERARLSLDQSAVVLTSLSSTGAGLGVVDSPHAMIVRTIGTYAAAAVDRVRSDLAAATLEMDRNTGTGSTLVQAISEWHRAYEAFGVRYQAAKARSTVHQGKLEQLEQLEQRGRSLRERVLSKRSELDGAGMPEADFHFLRSEWCALHDERFDLVNAQCERLTESSGGLIKASLRRAGAADAFLERLRATFVGTGITKAKTDKLWECTAADPSPIRFLQRLLDECEALSVAGNDGELGELPAVPLLRAAGITDKELGKLAGKLSADTWLDLCVVPLEDQPQFEYRLREDDYISFADASAGQQATALLWALLNQNGPPLLIDQPEDDLDNQVVLRIVEQIWRAKERRQLIFTSHNANVVVNGDADLVVCCDYRVDGEQAGGRIKHQGAIDVPDVRDAIATVMEGGRAAFSLRKEKYGF
jgi:type III restriction enzyme